MHSLSFKSKCLYDSEQKETLSMKGDIIYNYPEPVIGFFFENRDARIIVHTLVQ